MERKENNALEKVENIIAGKKPEHEQKEKEKKQKKDKTGALKTAVICLSIATIAMASVLTFVYVMPSSKSIALEGSYAKAFYDTVEEVNNIDANLSKTIVSKDTSAMQKYLVDVAVSSELCESSIQSLPLEDESKFYTTKLINQIGDYSKYVNNKLIDGEKLSAEDVDNLKRLYGANLSLKDTLNKVIEGMDSGFSFSSISKNGPKNALLDNFNKLQNLSSSYPELIYDGPFSDGLEDREIKGLKEAEISKDTAKQKVSEYFSDYKIKEISYLGKLNSEINCYNFNLKTEKGRIYAQVSEKGGKLITFSSEGSCERVNIDSAKAVENAKEFLNKTGTENMEAVWINLSDNVYTINFAYSLDDIPVYSDLIKVRVCAETGDVIGIEAATYYTNHVKREKKAASIGIEEASKNVSSSLSLTSGRLCVIPFGTKSEKLAYEFTGEADGSTYYVYISAETGKQLQMFKVIESGEGTLLI